MNFGAKAHGLDASVASMCVGILQMFVMLQLRLRIHVFSAS